MSEYKPRICLDFDGVIHSYISGWCGVNSIPDPPVKGAFDAITAYLEAGFAVAIHSSRSAAEDGIGAMRAWFDAHDFPSELFDRLEFPMNKPPALLYVDDRAFHFDGTNFPTIGFVREFKTWFEPKLRASQEAKD